MNLWAENFLWTRLLSERPEESSETTNAQGEDSVFRSKSKEAEMRVTGGSLGPHGWGAKTEKERPLVILIRHTPLFSEISFLGMQGICADTVPLDITYSNGLFR